MSSARRRGTRQGRRPKTGAGSVRPRDLTSGQRGRASAVGLSGRRVLWAPLAATFGLLLVSFVPRVQQHVVLTRSFWVAVAALLGWQAWLFFRLENASVPRSFHTLLRPQHYLQATLHTSVFVYWGYFWPPVYDHAWLLVGQLFFAYAFDMLLSWSRRDSYGLGFGPFPIIFSTNLFLWFRDDWFYLQFLMLAVGFLGKEFVRWNRDGRRVHIFNPSAFSLGLFSVVLIVTGTTNITWGDPIATTLNLAPNPFLFLFVVGLFAMYFFSITLVAAGAAAALFGLSALYMALTGVPFFIDSEIPIAVFLGLHLLVTDPSTSPRTAPGKLIFGLLYGAAVFGLYELLGLLSLPTFYDKLLCVPLLNLSVQRIDRMARALPQTLLVGRGAGQAIPRLSNLAHMAIWILLFGVMATRGAADGTHTGDSIPFWQTACDEDRRKACSTMALLEVVYCRDGSGWACNEVGVHYTEGFTRLGFVLAPNPEFAGASFSRACELGFQPGCTNLQSTGASTRGDPTLSDLRVLLRQGRLTLQEMSEADLRTRACEHGWTFACTGGAP